LGLVQQFSESVVTTGSMWGEAFSSGRLLQVWPTDYVTQHTL
jgi:hypothetical protein